MLKRLIKVLFTVILIISVSRVKINAYQVPDYDGLVNDYAEMFNEEFEKNWEQQLQELSKLDRGAEIMVVTVKDLNQEGIEDVSMQFFDTWKIGDQEKDNGVLLFISLNDREIYITTGYGIEPMITDSEAARITKDEIATHFKKQEYEKGIAAGLEAIIDQVINYEAKQVDEDYQINLSGHELWSSFFKMLISSLGLLMMVSIFSYMVSYLGRTKSWWLGGLIGAVLGMAIWGMIGSIITTIIGLIFDYILSKNYKYLKSKKKSTKWKSSKGGFSNASDWLFSSNTWKSSGSTGSVFKTGGGSSGGGGGGSSW